MLRRRKAVWGAALAALLAGTMLAVPAASSANPRVGDGLVPQELLDHFADCPDREEFPENTNLAYCARIKAYDGALKLGSVEASIDDPIEMMIGIGRTEPEHEIVMVPASGQGDGTSDPVKISGGILGIPALDPVLDNSLGLLSLTATPELGEVGAEAPDSTPTHLTPITLPLSIKLNNTLFGDNCRIGTPGDPIEINLTTGTTQPPQGVEPISGTPPTQPPQTAWVNYRGDFGGLVGGGGTAFHAFGFGARSVDNAFEVPGAKKCDLLGQPTHDAIEGLNDQLEGVLGSDLPVDELLGSEAGLFDIPVNSIAGLPSPAGNNRMELSVDTEWVTYEMIRIGDGSAKPLYSVTPGHLDFGEVRVGDSAELKTTIANPGEAPLTLGPGEGWDPFIQFVDDDCSGVTLAPGEDCDVQVRFSPPGDGEVESGGFFPVASDLRGLEFSTSGKGVGP